MQTKRIEYVDALRGFTMFLVVILLSLIMGNVIRLSPLLAHYLLGAKKT